MPSGTTSTRSAARAGERSRSPPRGSAGHDHPVRAAHGQRHQRAHAERPDAEVRFGMDAVVQVVDGHHARQRARSRGAGRREAVHQLRPRLRRQPRPRGPGRRHPLDAPRADRPAASATGASSRHGPARRAPVEEEGELQVVPPRQRRDQLARVDLQPAHLAGARKSRLTPTCTAEHAYGRVRADAARDRRDRRAGRGGGPGRPRPRRARAAARAGRRGDDDHRYVLYCRRRGTRRARPTASRGSRIGAAGPALARAPRPCARAATATSSSRRTAT